MCLIESPSRVRRIPGAEAEAVVATLAAAFADYPIMRFVLGPARDQDAVRLRTLINLFVSARVLRGAPILGVPAADGEGLAAAITTTPPVDLPASEAWETVESAAWDVLGPDARARYAQCREVWSALDVREPNLHVNMLGVRPEAQGQGHARRLLAGVFDLAAAWPTARGVSLTTEDPANLAFYQHLGFEVRASGDIAPGLSTWTLFRPRSRV